MALEYIANLDPFHDVEMLRSELPMIRACLRVLILCTTFLKVAAADGLSLAEIGEMMSREFHSGEEEPSELEVICIEARRLVAEEMYFSKSEADFEDFQFNIDSEDGGFDLTRKFASEDWFGSVNGQTPLSQLEECIEEEQEEEESEEEDKGHLSVQHIEKNPSVSKLSISLKNTSLGEKNQKFSEVSDYGYVASSSSGHRSANEQLPASVSFVKLADMNEEEWGMFLEKFLEMLYPAFDKRKYDTIGQRHRQRLGTSCQF